MPVPREKLDQLFADKEFLALNESEQTQLLDALNEAPAQQTQQAQQPTQASPRKIGIGDVAFGLRPHIVKAMEPKIQQAVAGLSQKKMLPEMPAGVPNYVVNPVSKALYGAVQQSSSPQAMAEFALKTASDPATYIAGPVLKASAPAIAVVGKTALAPFKALARTAPEFFNLWKAGGNLSTKNVEAFRGKIVGSINKTMKEAGEAFGSAIDDISSKATQPVDLNNYVQDITDEMIENPKIASIVRKTPGLSDLIKLQDKRLSLKDSQELFKMIGSKLKTTTGQIDFETRQALDTLKNGLRNAQIDSLGDDVLKKEFQIARETWARVKTDYDMVRKQLTPSGFENAVKTMFGDRNISKAAMNRLSPDDLLAMDRTSKALKVKKYAKGAAITAVGGGVLGAGAKLFSSLTD